MIGACLYFASEFQFNKESVLVSTQMFLAIAKLCWIDCNHALQPYQSNFMAIQQSLV